MLSNWHPDWTLSNYTALCLGFSKWHHKFFDPDDGPWVAHQQSPLTDRKVRRGRSLFAV